MAAAVSARSLRPHDGPEGQKWPGDVYERSQSDAVLLTSKRVVEVVATAPRKKRKGNIAAV
ncbi:hypothetical protein [Terrihabitans sp. B22-R8]|uniref:hypothetical protein n=1 Tax=Terrihabitans sp. B22-R8 TaxID=3425128 RepID=UPI00403C7DCA